MRLTLATARFAAGGIASALAVFSSTALGASGDPVTVDTSLVSKAPARTIEAAACSLEGRWQADGRAGHFDVGVDGHRCSPAAPARDAVTLALRMNAREHSEIEIVLEAEKPEGTSTASFGLAVGNFRRELETEINLRQEEREEQATAASVAAPSKPSSDWGAYPKGFAVTGSLGFATDPTSTTADHYGGGVLVDLQGIAHVGVFEAGAGGELATTVLAERTALSLLGGVGLHVGRLYPEFLLEAGAHHYSGVGSSPGLFGSGSPGASGSGAFAGLRLGLGRADAPQRSDTLAASGIAQIWLFARQDLSSSVVPYSYHTDGGLSMGEGAGTVSSSAMLGGTVELGVAVGGGFDLH
jgi:hypothetical protein